MLLSIIIIKYHRVVDADSRKNSLTQDTELYAMWGLIFASSTRRYENSGRGYNNYHIWSGI